MMQKPKHANLRSRGFTLMEVMVALFILSIMSMVAVSGLNAVLRAQSKQVAAAHQLQGLQFTYAWLTQDVGEFVVRPVRSAQGEILPAMMFNHDPLLQQVGIPGSIFLVLTRGGIVEASNISSLQRVAYALQDNQVIRYTWPVLDSTSATVIKSQVLLTGVAQLQTRYLNDKGVYFSNWQDYSDGGTPIALEWTITDTNGRDITWVIPIIGGGSGEQTAQTITQ